MSEALTSNPILIALNPINTLAKIGNVAENQMPTAVVLTLDNTADVMAQAARVGQAQRIELHFPKFTDGRAYSQATLLRQRLGFWGDIRATGDVLLDQLLNLQRCGFSSAWLRGDQNASKVPTVLGPFKAFYQGNSGQSKPMFGQPSP